MNAIKIYNRYFRKIRITPKLTNIVLVTRPQIFSQKSLPANQHDNFFFIFLMFKLKPWFTLVKNRKARRNIAWITNNALGIRDF